VANPWTVGEVLTADHVNQFLAPRAKIKTTTTTRVSTTTLADDPELAGLAVEANARYRLDLYLDVESGTVPDIKIQLTGPAGFDYRAVIWNGGFSAAANFTSPTVLTLACSGGTGGNSDRMVGAGWLTTGGTAGSITLQWAQSVSDPGNTALKNGSQLMLTRIS